MFEGMEDKFRLWLAKQYSKKLSRKYGPMLVQAAHDAFQEFKEREDSDDSDGSEKMSWTNKYGSDIVDAVKGLIKEYKEQDDSSGPSWVKNISGDYEPECD